MVSTSNAMPLIEHGYRDGGQPGREVAQPPDVQPASHHALTTAYNDLKKRYNDLEQKNKSLGRRVKDLQRSDSFKASPLSSADLTPTASRESSPQIFRSGAGSSFSANGSLSVSEEQVNASLLELEQKLIQLEEQEKRLIDEKIHLTDRCRDVEQANAALSGENSDIKQNQQSLYSHLKVRENELLDKHGRLEKENEQCLRKNISLEKRIKFLEKQLFEQKVKNSHLEEEYLLSKSEWQEDVSNINIVDESETVIEDLKCTVHQYHVELRDLMNVVCDQKSMIEHLLRRETDRNSALSSQRWSRASIGLSSVATSHGARPKTSQRSPSFKSKAVPSQQTEPNSDPRELKDTLNPQDSVMHDKYHRRSTSQGSQEARSFHSSSGKNGNEAEKSYDYGNQSYKLDAMSNWLGQLHMARNDSLEHLNDLQDDEDVLGNLDVLDNLDDNMVVDQEHGRGQTRPGLPAQSGAMAAARPSQFAASTLPRQSHRLTIQDMQRMNAGNSLNVQTPHSQSTSADRESRRRSSDVRSPNSEMENRYRPNSASQQPRPLNIERNEDNTIPRSYDNTTQNVNLNSQTGKERPERPDHLVLNNDPLTGHKVIPSRNIYREEAYVKEAHQVAMNPGDAMRICPICNVDFPPSRSMEEFQQHVLDCCDSVQPGEEHSPSASTGLTITVESRVCPVCNSEFPFMIDQKDFEDHVNAHFEAEERRRREFEMIEP